MAQRRLEAAPGGGILGALGAKSFSPFSADAGCGREGPSSAAALVRSRPSQVCYARSELGGGRGRPETEYFVEGEIGTD